MSECFAELHRVRLAEIRGLEICVCHLRVSVKVFLKGHVEPGARGAAVGEELDELLAHLGQHATEVQRTPGHLQNWRGMQVRVNVQKVGDLQRLVANVRLQLEGVKEQLHVQRAQVAMNELQERRGQTGNRLRRKVVVLVQAVFFGVERYIELVVRLLVEDKDTIHECSLYLSHPFSKRHQPPVDLTHDFVGQVRDVDAGRVETASTWLGRVHGTCIVIQPPRRRSNDFIEPTG